MLIIIALLLYIIAWSVAPEAMGLLHVGAFYLAIFVLVLGAIVLGIAAFL